MAKVRDLLGKVLHLEMIQTTYFLHIQRGVVMINQLSWKVGGQQGEGIESTGEIFAIALNRLGYYLYGYRHFSSRIKGGHTNNKIRVSTTEVRSISDDLDILVAFDQETIDVNYKELHSKGVILADSKFNPKNQKIQKHHCIRFHLPRLLLNWELL